MATKKKAVKKTAARFVKGSKAAKDFMAKLRAKRSEGKYQYGKTNKVKDKRLQAKKPGKRKSAAGNIYYENSENRSDKGRLLGIGNITMDKLHKFNKDIINMELALDKNIKTSKLFPYKNPFWKKELAKNKKNIKKFINELKKHKTELKKLL